MGFLEGRLLGTTIGGAYPETYNLVSGSIDVLFILLLIISIFFYWNIFKKCSSKSKKYKSLRKITLALTLISFILISIMIEFIYVEMIFGIGPSFLSKFLWLIALSFAFFHIYKGYESLS